MTTTSRVLSLKKDADALFRGKRYTEAYQKYTAAIELDTKNAILYSNRAGCSLALQKYPTAREDAEKATELDPTYAKAWARLAKALSELRLWGPSFDAWKHALEALPRTNPSPDQIEQFKLYTASRSRAQEAMQRDFVPTGPTASGIYDPNYFRVDARGHVTPIDAAERGDMPWDIARELLKGQKDDPSLNTARILDRTYKDFHGGLQELRAYYTNLQAGTLDAKTLLSAFHQGQPLRGMVDAILRDSRIFHIPDPHFLRKWNETVKHEADFNRAWPDQSPDVVLSEVSARLDLDGWEVLRPALDTTVRDWVMRGFIAGDIGMDVEAAEHCYMQAIEILERGGQTWTTVPDEDRGAIFGTLFMRGLRSLHIEQYMDAYDEFGPEKYPTDTLMRLAKDLLEEVTRVDPSDEVKKDPATFLPFWTYPTAKATTAKAFCELQAGLSIRQVCEDIEEAIPSFKRAAELYLSAAEMYPEDDILRYLNLTDAVLVYLKGPIAPLSVTLRLIERIREGIPMTLQIMGRAPAPRDDWGEQLNNLYMWAEEAREALSKGMVSLDSLPAMGLPQKDGTYLI